MPNIMLTYRCNLHCSYCFANEFVNKQNTDITFENFEKAISFLTKTGSSHIGLIGGEPTLHPKFGEMMERLISNERVDGITVYTNGLLLQHYIPLLTDPKVRILINCNSPAVIGERAFQTIRNNLDKLITEKGIRDRINLGINLYSDDMDYEYMVELLKRYALHRVRISVTVPDFSACGKVDVLEYFKSRKQFLLGFLRVMDSIQVVPYYDCNKPPYCIWTDEEKKWLESYVAKYPIQDSNLIGNHSQCFPVIDILPNLQAVRCFGMSDYLKLNIDDFKDVPDIANYFINSIDSNAYKISACADCRECYERNIRHCTAGCIGFKAAQITAANDFFSNL